ncbi:hypothetical protein BTVI_30802 [Pitangus sulphuratus]|nr:hypothetical protein BTVI_30802 [Pitangus sulphuratus]
MVPMELGKTRNRGQQRRCKREGLFTVSRRHYYTLRSQRQNPECEEKRGYFEQQVLALSSSIFTDEILYQAASTGCTHLEVGAEKGHRYPGEWSHQGSGCHWHQHLVEAGTGSPGAAVTALLRRAAACQQAPYPGVHHVAKQQEDEDRHYEEERAIQHVPRIAGTPEHHRREDLLTGSWQQGHSAVTQNSLVTDAKTQCLT